MTKLDVFLPFQQVDRVLGLEVLVLDERLGPPQPDGGHQLVHDLVVLLPVQPGLLDACECIKNIDFKPRLGHEKALKTYSGHKKALKPY